MTFKRCTRVLCYGDSNTWGYDPESDGRYDENKRWTGVLGSLLGEDYVIIEEGLNGRTTDVDYPDRIGRNGYSYLIPCLDSHYPLDYVVLNLGTNDTKAMFQRSPERIALGIERLIQVILGKGLEDSSPNVKLVLIAPTKIREIGLYAETMKGACVKIMHLATLCQALAEDYDLAFVNLSDIEPSPKDGIHLSAEAHERIAKMVFERIRG